jgi:hypothetical protein
MNRLFLVLLTTLISAGFVSGQDKKVKKDPTELAVIKRFLGTWDVTVTNQSTSGEEKTYKAVSRRTWDDVGNTVRFEDEQPNGRPPLQMSLRHDSNVGNYPMAIGVGEPSFQIFGSWDEKASTMEFVGSLPNGSELTLNHLFSSPDKAIVSGKVTDKAGNVAGKLVFHQTRRKGDK